MLKFPGMPRTRENKPRRMLSGGLKFVTECDKYCGFGDTRQESFDAWKEARDTGLREDRAQQEVQLQEKERVSKGILDRMHRLQ
jgi:hypothetical protein